MEILDDAFRPPFFKWALRKSHRFINSSSSCVRNEICLLQVISSLSTANAHDYPTQELGTYEFSIGTYAEQCVSFKTSIEEKSQTCPRESRNLETILIVSGPPFTVVVGPSFGASMRAAYFASVTVSHTYISLPLEESCWLRLNFRFLWDDSKAGKLDRNYAVGAMCFYVARSLTLHDLLKNLSQEGPSENGLLCAHVRTCSMELAKLVSPSNRQQFTSLLVPSMKISFGDWMLPDRQIVLPGAVICKDFVSFLLLCLWAWFFC